MLNILIIDKDINNSRNLLNYISKNSQQLRVHSIVNSLTEGIKILNTGLIDITIIKLDYKIDYILNKINNISITYFEKYKKSIIILSKNIENTKSNPSVYEYLSYNESIPTLYIKINEIAKSKISQVNHLLLLNKINKELEYIGYNLSYIGTKYLSECIALIYNNYDSSDNLNKNIYPILAQKYHKTINNVKCNITSATNAMFYECDETRLKNYFNFYTISRPKPKLVIYTVLNKLYKII